MSRRKETAAYEQPLNERVRTLLRLEFLFRQAQFALGGDSEWHSRQVIATLIEILGVLAARGDVRMELIKELERLAATLARLESSPGVDPDRLRPMLEQCRSLIQELKTIHGAPGSQLKQNELLTAIMQRTGIPGGTCGFDLPAFQHWLLQPAGERHAEVQTWLRSLEPLRQAADLVLRMLRESATPRPLTAGGGVFQQSLDRDTAYQLLRVELPADAPYFAEISGSKYFFTIRFMQQHDSRERPLQTGDDVPFMLSCCAV